MISAAKQPWNRGDAVLDPFFLRAIAAAVGLAIVAAPLGSLVVWNRMAYLGETVAQASLIGIALGLAFQINITVGVLFVTVIVAGLLLFLSRQKAVPLDSVLGLMHHGALALGVIATSMIKGPSVDLLSYLFGDIFAVSADDLWWVYGGGLVVLVLVAQLWQPMLRLAVHEELATAEGVPREWVKGLFVMLLAIAIAIGMKIVGALLVIAFLIVPAVAARPLAATPERMVAIAAAMAVLSSLVGLNISAAIDAPGGPSIVLVMSVLAGCSLAWAALRKGG